MAYFDTYLGQYVLQALLHSCLVMLVVEVTQRVWQATLQPRVRFRYRLLVIALPPLMYPLFQLLNPRRGSFYFRHDTALFDTSAWLAIKVLGGVPLLPLLLALLLLSTTLVTLLQELVPIGRELLAARHEPEPSDSDSDTRIEEMVRDLSERIGVPKPQVGLLDDDEPLIYTTGTRSPRIVLSNGLVRFLDELLLRAALAHEVAHLVRSNRLITVSVFVLRLLMFFNPVTLLMFRQIVQDDEQVCDDITVALTGSPRALAQLLRRFQLDQSYGVGETLAVQLEDKSHNLLLQDRIERLESLRSDQPERFDVVRFMLTLAALLALSYFVV